MSNELLDIQIIETSKEDSILRQLVENEDKYNLNNITKDKEYYLEPLPLSKQS